MISSAKWVSLLATALLASLAGPTSAGEPSTKLDDLSPLTGEAAGPVKGDWLVVPVARKTGVYRSGPSEITMTNGLIRRTWRLAPNGACVGFDNLISGAALLRGVKPELRLQLDGKQYDVGGLAGQPLYAYLSPEWLDKMTADPAAFRLTGFEVGKTAARFPWKRARYAAALPWPPPGASLTLHFRAPAKSPCGDLAVSVHYEMYDGIPLVCKWATIRNGNPRPTRLNSFVNEILAAVEAETTGVVKPGWEYPNLHVESDYAFNGGSPLEADVTTNWIVDPQYTTQRWTTPALLESRPPVGPDAAIAPCETFETFRTFELIYDSTERERNGLALRRMYRTVAPWVTENPIFMNCTSTAPADVRRIIDQCAELGFELVNLSYLSGFDIENLDQAYVAKIKAWADYAHSKGLQFGGYSLLASRSVGPKDDVIDPKTGKPGGAVYDSMPCLGSRWGEEYLRKVRRFIEIAGLDLFDNDGSYPGDQCASTTHPGHRGLADSQWVQWKRIAEHYRWCRGRGIYLIVPDWYFLNGSSKVFLGYNEKNWQLSPDRQVLLSRQNIFDGTWQKTPSMGWSFLPLVQVYGTGTDASTIEPLCDHLDVYEAQLAQNFCSGVQSYYRGLRLYDTNATKAVVKRWIDFYKRYRPILDSDVIHVRRPDSRDVDCLLHVNPQLKEKGLAAVFNPLDRPVQKTLTLPLYYTGLTETATIRREEGEPATYRLDRRYNVEVPLQMAPRSATWLLIE